MYEPVLVLNANFEPINVCNMRRAIGLILNDKANLVLNGRGEIRTVNRVYPVSFNHPFRPHDQASSARDTSLQA